MHSFRDQFHLAKKLRCLLTSSLVNADKYKLEPIKRNHYHLAGMACSDSMFVKTALGLIICICLIFKGWLNSDLFDLIVLAYLWALYKFTEQVIRSKWKTSTDLQF